MVRVKNRYILFEVELENQKVLKDKLAATLYGISPNATLNKDIQEDDKDIKSPKLTIGLLINKFRSSIQLNFGEAGAAKVASNLTVKYFNQDTNVGILRTYRDHYKMVWASLTLINNINRKPCAIRIIHISGTINKVQEQAISYDRQILYKLGKQIQIQRELDNKKNDISKQKVQEKIDLLNRIEKSYRKPEIEVDQDDTA